LFVSSSSTSSAKKSDLNKREFEIYEENDTANDKEFKEIKNKSQKFSVTHVLNDNAKTSFDLYKV
jgi:hypothetical protein